MSNIELVERADRNAIAGWVEAHLVKALAGENGNVAITVPGGSTPFPIFEELVKREIDWNRIEIWPGDDRIVPEDHAASNTGKLRSIFEPAGAQIVALSPGAQPPHFTLAWLGIGGDGHIASLFPNTDPQIDDLEKVRQLTPDPLPPEAPFDRITLTIPALLNSERVMFTLGGSADKKGVFVGAVQSRHDLPVARLLSVAIQPVTCFT